MDDVNAFNNDIGNPTKGGKIGIISHYNKQGLPVTEPFWFVRAPKTITDTWSMLHSKLTKHGHETKYFILDNKVRATLKGALSKQDKTYELTPPNIHTQNAAERAICTFKNHLKSGLATCDPKFPLQEWDQLLK